MIVSDDISYQDEDVCILKPEVKKGILIFTNYTKPEGVQSICDIGLKTGAKLHEEGINFGRIVYHPYIFFRAPYLNNPIDYTSIETEIVSSYGTDLDEEPESLSTKLLGITPRVWIRIDPNNTYVYSSEIRVSNLPSIYSSEIIDSKLPSNKTFEGELNKSRKKMTEYLQIIKDNEMTNTCGLNVFYNLITSKIGTFPINIKHIRYPWHRLNINRQSEVLVRLSHLTQKYFVKCT